MDLVKPQANTTRGVTVAELTQLLRQLEVGAGLSLTLSGDIVTLDLLGGGSAPADAEYVVGALHGSLTAERLLTNTAQITWDLATAGQAKANVVAGLFELVGVAAGLIITHEAAADPHTGYQKESEKNLALGYAGLDVGIKLDGAQQKYGTLVNTACEGNDMRLSDARTPLVHVASHQDGGSDELSVVGLSGLLADPQKVTVRKNSGADIGSRKRLNVIEGSNATLTVIDDAVGDEVAITIAAAAGGAATPNYARTFLLMGA